MGPIRGLITDSAKRDDIQAKIDGGANGIEHALDLLDDGGATDTPYRHLVTAALAEMFMPKIPPLDLHSQFVSRIAQHADPSVKVFSINYDPLIERAAAPGFHIYQSVHAQLTCLQKVLSGEERDHSRLQQLNFGVYAAKEFEYSDPEFADALFPAFFVADRLARGIEVEDVPDC